MWFKTAGVPVSYLVYRAVRAGNKARDRREWPEACRCYQSALARDPGLGHIWIQLGHALKESGDLDRARDAYERAQLLSPEAAEPSLHIGHVRKRQGDPAAAGHHYLAALQKEPGSAEALRELRHLLGRGELRDIDRAELERAGMRFPHASEWRARAERPRTAPGYLFDVSDLVAHFGRTRHPTGIQRVQIGIASALLEKGDNDAVRLCVYVAGKRGWCGLPRSVFVELLERTGSAEAPTDLWNEQLDGLRLALGTAEPIIPAPGDILVNLGSSWSLDGYLPAVARMRAEFGLRYAPFIHDLIPVIRPELCDSGVAAQFRQWIERTLGLADHFLVNSQSTAGDLLAFAEGTGRRIDASAVTVVPLNADFLSPRAERSADEMLEGWSLRPGFYVLFVGTIEPRKNHLLAFAAWERLISTHGADAVPPLVCVGRRGWLSDDVFARLEGDAALRSRVLMLHDVSDEELAQLYSHCLFTLYPSEHEGWGLPITEALCHGKVPVIPAAASVREAGGPFASYFAPGSSDDLVARAEELLFDPSHRTRREEQVRRQFRPRPWGEIADQILSSLAPPPPRPSRWTFRLRSKGDAARDRRDWHKAIDAYSAHLEREPLDFAIWVQLGHCLKEAGLLDEALGAYGRAAALDDRDADLHLQLGHLFKLLGRPFDAITAYRTSAMIDPGRGEALLELDRLDERFSTFGRASEPREGLDALIARIEAHAEAKGDIFASYYASFQRAGGSSLTQSR